MESKDGGVWHADDDSYHRIQRQGLLQGQLPLQVLWSHHHLLYVSPRPCPGFEQLDFLSGGSFLSPCISLFNLSTFQGTIFPLGFGQEIVPAWPRQPVARFLLQILLIPLYLVFMVAIGPVLPMFRCEEYLNRIPINYQYGNILVHTRFVPNTGKSG